MRLSKLGMSVHARRNFSQKHPKAMADHPNTERTRDANIVPRSTTSNQVLVGLIVGLVVTAFTYCLRGSRRLLRKLHPAV